MNDLGVGDGLKAVFFSCLQDGMILRAVPGMFEGNQVAQLVAAKKLNG